MYTFSAHTFASLYKQHDVCVREDDDKGRRGRLHVLGRSPTASVGRRPVCDSHRSHKKPHARVLITFAFAYTRTRGQYNNINVYYNIMYGTHAVLSGRYIMYILYTRLLTDRRTGVHAYNISAWFYDEIMLVLGVLWRTRVFFCFVFYTYDAYVIARAYCVHGAYRKLVSRRAFLCRRRETRLI